MGLDIRQQLLAAAVLLAFAVDDREQPLDRVLDQRVARGFGLAGNLVEADEGPTADDEGLLNAADRPKLLGFDLPGDRVERLDVLDQVIERKLLVQEARRLGMKISPKELDQAILEIRKDYPGEGFGEKLGLKGITLEEGIPFQVSHRYTRELLHRLPLPLTGAQRRVLAEIKADPALRHIPVVVVSTSRSADDVARSATRAISRS